MFLLKITETCKSALLECIFCEVKCRDAGLDLWLSLVPELERRRRWPHLEPLHQMFVTWFLTEWNCDYWDLQSICTARPVLLHTIGLWSVNAFKKINGSFTRNWVEASVQASTCCLERGYSLLLLPPAYTAERDVLGLQLTDNCWACSGFVDRMILNRN